METLGWLIGVVVLGLILWAQFGALFERRYARRPSQREEPQVRRSDREGL